MHSAIERASKNIQVNTPSEWSLICKLARRSPRPYSVIELTHDNFIDWSLLAEGNKVTPTYMTVTGEKVKWLAIKWVRYTKDNPNSILFKYNYEDNAF